LKKTKLSEGGIVVALCCAVYFISYLARLDYSAVMAEMIARNVLDKEGAGLIGTALFFAYGAGQLVSGYLGDKIKPQYIIAIDSLAAASAQRIKDTIQMSNTGIAPGAGVGNKRCGINRETLGVPVYALGIPMVVYASSVLEDFLERNNDGRMRLSAEDYINENIRELIVTPKEIDVIIDDCSRMLADGLNLALHDGVNMEEIRDFMY